MDNTCAHSVKKTTVSTKVSLELKDAIKAYSAKHGFNSESDFFRHLIRKEIEHDREKP
ncbi:MAG: ribbon-helix-helix domain-containing protein [Candidatus Aenigmarchaeota archaeon]|nr:ribbon-helix-helix domain-containing protein [Candidatus Aenigmarchaeota archaeon]